MKDYLKPQPTEESPYVINDYPYGFRLRTKIRYYVEGGKRGQHLVSQTLNPKTLKWNKPKKSTYSDLIFTYINSEDGHLEYTVLDVTNR